MSFIIGTELHGKTDGYNGAGIELHERNMKAIKNFLFPPRHKK